MADKKTPNTSKSSNKSSRKVKTTKASVTKKTKASSSVKQQLTQTEKGNVPSTTANVSTEPSSTSMQKATPVTSAGDRTTSTTTPTKSSNGLSVLAILLSLGALATSGYLVYSNMVKNVTGNTNLAVGLTEIQGNVVRISDAVTNLKGDIQQVSQEQSNFVNSDSVSRQLQQKIAPIQEQQTALSEALSVVRQQVSGNDSEYVINRIAQLLETANMELNLSKNNESALLALRMADEQIKISNNRSLDVVRSKLLTDIEALKVSKKVDLASISIKILAMSSVIETWPLQNEPNVEVIENKQSDEKSQGKRSFFDELKSTASQVVKEAVRVQKVDGVPKPLLVPEQRYFLNQNLRLQLLSAQNAALQGEQKIYQENIASATQWIKDYFDMRDQRVQDAVKNLDGISGINLKAEVYDISATLKSFNEVTANPSKG